MKTYRLTAAALAVGIVLAAAAVAVTGSLRADAAQQQRPPLQTSGSILGSAAAMSLSDEQMTPASSGVFIYRDGRYTALDSVAGRPTSHTGINNRGQITGSYLSDGGTVRGFIRDTNGHYTSFDAARGGQTVALRINAEGAVVGTYGGTEANGFVRSPDGKVTTVDVPGASSTFLYGINDRGAVVGGYTAADGRDHGFRLEGGVLTFIDPPDFATDPAARQSLALDINNQGQIVGTFVDSKGTYHGYLDDNGRFTRLDPPGAADVPNFATTAPFGINDLGQVVGQYVDAAGVLHGYLWQPGRGFSTIDPPQITSFTFPVPGAGTIAADINDHGQILLPMPGSDFKARVVPASG